MKRQSILLLAIVIFFTTTFSKADLYDRGRGLIYDDVLDITWFQNANYGAGSIYDNGSDSTDGSMTWDNAMAWAEQLVYDGYDDWRLPSTVDGPYVLGYDGTTTGGYNITSSEMGFLYHQSLGNLGYLDTNGTHLTGWGLNNTSYFNNIQTGNAYWSNTELAQYTDAVWTFQFYYGDQGYDGKIVSNKFAWAVRDGDVEVIPAPSAVILGSLGLTFSGWLLKRKRML